MFYCLSIFVLTQVLVILSHQNWLAAVITQQTKKSTVELQVASIPQKTIPSKSPSESKRSQYIKRLTWQMATSLSTDFND